MEARAGAFATGFPVLVSNSDAVLSSIAVQEPADGFVQYLGESFNLAALDVRGTFTDKEGNLEEKPLTLFSVSGYDAGKRGSQEITVSANGKTALVPLSVKVPASAEVLLAAVVGKDNSILKVNGDTGKVTIAGHNTAFIRGQSPGMANAKFHVSLKANGVNYALESGDGINPEDVSGFDKDAPGLQTVTLRLDGLEVPYSITVPLTVKGSRVAEVGWM